MIAGLDGTRRIATSALSAAGARKAPSPVSARCSVAPSANTSLAR